MIICPKFENNLETLLSTSAIFRDDWDPQSILHVIPYFLNIKDKIRFVLQCQHREGCGEMKLDN